MIISSGVLAVFTVGTEFKLGNTILNTLGVTSIFGCADDAL